MSAIEDRIVLNISERLGWLGIVLSVVVACATAVGFLITKWWACGALGLLFAAELFWIGASEIWRRYLFVSEDGLCVTRPIGKTYIGWGEISRIRVSRNRVDQCIKSISIIAIKPSRSPIANKLQGGQVKAIVISGSAPDIEYAINILGKHVPNAIQETHLS